MAEKIRYLDALLAALGWASKVGRRSDQPGSPSVRTRRHHVPEREAHPAVELPDVGRVGRPDG